MPRTVRRVSPRRRTTARASSRFSQPAVTLRPHQRRVVAHMEATQQRGVLLWHSLGSGKTITSLAVAQLTPNHPIVVICPASMRDQWRASMRQMHVASKRYSLHSYEGFGNDVGTGGARTDGAVLILDEVHRIRNASGKHAKTIEHAARAAHRAPLGASRGRPADDHRGEGPGLPRARPRKAPRPRSTGSVPRRHPAPPLPRHATKPPPRWSGQTGTLCPAPRTSQGRQRSAAPLAQRLRGPRLVA